MQTIHHLGIAYHGTNLFSANIILRYGITLQAQRRLTDFGKGFYVTPHLRQAKQWANVKAQNPQFQSSLLKMLNTNKEQYLYHPYTKIPAFITFSIDTYQLTQYNGLIFPSPSQPEWTTYEKKWESFVRNNRMGLQHSYDFAYGPVGKSQINVLPSQTKTQLSFHHERTLQCLSILGITTIPSISSESYMEEHYQYPEKHRNKIIVSFLIEIRDQITRIVQCSKQEARHLINHSWIANEVYNPDTILLHENPAYWAYLLLYGDGELWYKDYENYVEPTK